MLLNQLALIKPENASKECIICCHYWCFKDVGYKFEPHVGNACDDILMMVYELKNITIMNVKGVDYGCVLWNMTRMMQLICWVILN